MGRSGTGEFKRRGVRVLPEQQAVALWQGLRLGQWTVLGEFECDARRHVLGWFDQSIKNTSEPDLTARQSEVATRVALGHSLKVIAHDLGVATSTISAHLAHISARLQLEGSSRAELVARFPHLWSRLTGVSAVAVAVGSRPALKPSNAPEEGAAPVFMSAERFRHDGRDWVILSYPLIPRELWKPLTQAERSVATLMLRGFSNDKLAAARCCSPHTVANQVTAIFRKLGVFSRAELIARVLSEPAEPSGESRDAVPQHRGPPYVS
jgi:DNA-binding NarL/FixJ family response regulator